MDRDDRGIRSQIPSPLNGPNIPGNPLALAYLPGHQESTSKAMADLISNADDKKVAIILNAAIPQTPLRLFPPMVMGFTRFLLPPSPQFHVAFPDQPQRNILHGYTGSKITYSAFPSRVGPERYTLLDQALP